MTSFHHLKSIIGRSFADFREYFSPADFSFYFLLAMYFIIDITRIKFFPMASNAQKLIFEIGASILLLPFSSMVIADIILIRKSRDLSVPKENIFNNTLTFMLTSIVAMLIAGIGSLFLVLPGIALFVVLSMAPFIAVYEEGEGWYPFRRSIDLIGKEKFLMVFGGLLFLSLIQLIPGSIPYSDNLYLAFFIGVFKAIFFPLNIIFSSFLMINLYQFLREEQLAAMVASEEYV
ncbi:hypothetical protein C0V70_11665 [Bacteriovorax stolpii]|uniref:Uncharacterized protein n=2 Tax=Bacteriovorax stolpii TaxID=960 RepID=A0A2K9NUH2_BACTC|nr:hypothetical protein C0V70_11665 [Bacteriovorax stolpii]